MELRNNLAECRLKIAIDIPIELETAPFYLFGYKLEEMERVPKFAPLAEIYGCMNTDLKLFA